MRAIIFDTETTGLLLPSTVPLDKQPRIIEIGAVLTDGERVVDTLSQLIQPGCYIHPDITKITGIENSDVQDAPTFMDFYNTLARFFEDSDYLICHNAPFDVGMLQNELTRIEDKDFPWPRDTICTAQEYTTRYGSRPSMKQLYQWVIGQPLAQTHRALDDAMALYTILEKDRFFDILR